MEIPEIRSGIREINIRSAEINIAEVRPWEIRSPVVDRIGPDFHELSGKAKDIASAAVFISILLMLITWVSILFLAPS